MNDLAISKVPTLAEIKRLQSAMSSMPQAVLETEHYFADGMYARKLTRPAGTLIVGKVHKKEHFFVIAKGSLIIWTEGGMKELGAGTVLMSKPGTKRVTLAMEDSVGITFHHTEKTDLDEVEAELIEPEDEALFDAHNLLKTLPCPG